MILIELDDSGFESKLATSELQALDEIGGAGEQDAPAVFDQGKAERCREVTLAAAGRSSVILPGVRQSRFGFSIRFTRAAVKALRPWA